MDMEYKKVWRFFSIADFEQEERWLNDMSASGWNFVRTNGLIFTFRKGTPGEFIYKMDLPENNAHGLGKEEYYLFLTECGNRIVCQNKDWIYLRKSAADGPFETSDNTYPRLKMVNKAYGYANKVLCRLLSVFTIIALVLKVLAISLSSDCLDGMSYGVAFGAIMSLALIFVPIISRLRRKMNILVDEIGIKR